MKTLKLLFITLITSISFTSCVIVDDGIVGQEITLEEVVTNYDLWYIDYHRTTGSGDVPFLSKAFTVSFQGGRMYANNNIADIGFTGSGLGILVGDYYTDRNILETEHDLDRYYDFNVVELSANEIRIDDRSQNVSYYLIGYNSNNFDYDKLFYENIEFFLQEYEAWERIAIDGGIDNFFDEEHFLQFTPENITTFYSSQDPFGTNIGNIYWDFAGSYVVYDVAGYDDLKGLTLNYDNGDTETFELSVVNDGTIRLHHQTSDSYYTFSGRGFIQYLKGEKVSAKKAVRNSGRKRTKVIRETVERKNLK